MEVTRRNFRVISNRSGFQSEVVEGGGQPAPYGPETHLTRVMDSYHEGVKVVAITVTQSAIYKGQQWNFVTPEMREYVVGDVEGICPKPCNAAECRGFAPPREDDFDLATLSQYINLTIGALSLAAFILFALFA